MPPQNSDRLYKFIAERYAAGMLDLGRIKIGTAEEYRVPDGNAGGRADADELAVGWEPGSGIVDPDQADKFRKLLGREHAKNVQFAFAEGARITFVSNAYMYSMSWEITNEIKNRMESDFGANACIEIAAPLEFSKIISSHPLLAGRQWHLAPVDYISENVSAKIREQNPFQKLDQFSWQKETRLIWDGNAGNGEIIDVPDARRLFKRIF